MAGFGDRVRAFASSEDSLARVFRNSGWLFSAKGISAITSIIYLAILTRSLGPAGFGRFILIVSTVQILAALFRLQTWQSVVQFGARHAGSGDSRAFSRLAWSTLLIEAAGGLIAILILLFAADPLSKQFGWDNAMRDGLLLYGILTFLALRSTPTGILRAHDRFGDGAIGDATVSIVRLLGCLAIWLLAPDFVAFLIAWGMSELLAAAILWGFVRHRRLLVRTAPAPLSKEYWTFLAATNGSFILNVLRERGVVLVVGLAVSDAAAGLFRLADQLANSVNRITEIFARPLFTELARLKSAGDSAGARALFWRSIKISAGAGAGIFLLLVGIGQPLILMIAGRDFLAAYPLLLILGAATIVGLAGLGLEPLLQASDKSHLAVTARIAGLLLLAPMLIYWLPIYDTAGAAWALLASALLPLAMMLWWSRRTISN